MVSAALRYVMRIAVAWLITLLVTIVLAGSLYYLLESPDFGIAV
jgi:phosphate/sulfate permease